MYDSPRCYRYNFGLPLISIATCYRLVSRKQGNGNDRVAGTYTYLRPNSHIDYEVNPDYGIPTLDYEVNPDYGIPTLDYEVNPDYGIATLDYEVNPDYGIPTLDYEVNPDYGIPT